MELELRKENVSVTIMPLGLIYTEHSLGLLKANTNYKAISEPGITSEVSYTYFVWDFL